ncbi:MAG: hypothetical protein MRERV_1c116 [Mycoplasmataceae bacterium RV_VA103A]|nr:MAG: hypothetical protein MRERV_1c116 [Mycoplasmataceae bacterium RV_VA103A]
MIIWVVSEFCGARADKSFTILARCGVINDWVSIII